MSLLIWMKECVVFFWIQSSCFRNKVVIIQPASPLMSDGTNFHSTECRWHADGFSGRISEKSNPSWWREIIKIGVYLEVRGLIGGVYLLAWKLCAVWRCSEGISLLWFYIWGSEYAFRCIPMWVLCWLVVCLLWYLTFLWSLFCTFMKFVREIFPVVKIILLLLVLFDARPPYAL